GRRYFLRNGSVEAAAGGCGLACSSLHLGRLLAGRSLAAQTGTLLRAGPQIQHPGSSGRRRPDTTQRQWAPGLRARAGVEHSAGLDRLGLREVREPSAVPQRDAARGRHSAIAGDLAPKGVRRFVSTCYVLEGPRSLRRRRQGDQTRQTALEAVAWTAGRHTGRASVGCFEPADRHGGEHEGAPRRRGWRGKPDRRLVVENGRGRARQAVVGGIGSALLQPELSAPGSGGGWSFPHPLLFQYLFRPRPGPASSGAPRCTRPANRAGVGTFGQVRGT